MQHHEERPASSLAYGPAKPDDIERARRQLQTAGARAGLTDVERAISEAEAACQVIQDDLSELKRVVYAGQPRTSASPPA